MSILEGFDNEAEIKVSNAIVEHETVFSDITDVVYNVNDKTVCLVGNGVVADGVDDTEIPEPEGE